MIIQSIITNDFSDGYMTQNNGLDYKNYMTNLYQNLESLKHRYAVIDLNHADYNDKPLETISHKRYFAGEIIDFDNIFLEGSVLHANNIPSIFGDIIVDSYIFCNIYLNNILTEKCAIFFDTREEAELYASLHNL
jgi:hypothetical protein